MRRDERARRLRRSLLNIPLNSDDASSSGNDFESRAIQENQEQMLQNRSNQRSTITVEFTGRRRIYTPAVPRHSIDSRERRRLAVCQKLEKISGL